jgi:hypothetical protein
MEKEEFAKRIPRAQANLYVKTALIGTHDTHCTTVQTNYEGRSRSFREGVEALGGAGIQGTAHDTKSPLSAAAGALRAPEFTLRA